MRKIDLEAEKLFENAKVANKELVRGRQSKYYWAIQPSIDKCNRLNAEISKGKRVLEIGCSTGGLAVEIAPKSKIYVGIDLSGDAIKKAKENSIENANFFEADAHKLKFGNGEFDVVIVNGLLHHLDLKEGLSEIHRVLSPNGCLCAREPLGTNPLFQLYRKFTPQARTVDEKPFDCDDLKLMYSLFSVERMEFFGFTCILSAFLQLMPLRHFLTIVDAIIAKTALRTYFWMFSGVFIKR